MLLLMPIVQVMAMVEDSAAMLDAANPTLKAVVGDNEEKCDTCKLIVTQVATMLRNPVRRQRHCYACPAMHALLCMPCYVCPAVHLYYVHTVLLLCVCKP